MANSNQNYLRFCILQVRVRLGEMADFLQRLLSDGGDGLLNASALSNRHDLVSLYLS